jgi:tRNA dimethylallyltransferase
MSSTADLGANSLRVICGPTGAGKSALAMSLAERFGATIISADSRQIYRGFDIGTSKPSATDRARVPHLGVDVVDPIVRYSAAAWAEAAKGWISETIAAGRVPLIVGGTGFYLRALFEPLFEEPPVDAQQRECLEQLLEPLPLDELRRWCVALDPARAHLGRAQLLRAIETALLTGRRLSELHRDKARVPTYTARYLLVDPGARLVTRIATRIDAMFEGGWTDEVRTLERTVPANAPAWNACGYTAIRAMIAGQCDRAAARQAVLVHTRQYAKRQRTWFRHQLAGADVTHVDPDEQESADRVLTWWNGERNA